MRSAYSYGFCQPTAGAWLDARQYACSEDEPTQMTHFQTKLKRNRAATPRYVPMKSTLPSGSMGLSLGVARNAITHTTNASIALEYRLEH